MPHKRWVHVIVNARNTWLHGDPRGFRDRDHRLHSDGDYKHPPPPGEHAALHRYFRDRAGPAVHFPHRLRPVLLDAFIRKAKSLGHHVIAASCGDTHLHTIIELPPSYAEAVKKVGKCKQAANHAVRGLMPGGIWAAGVKVKRIVDPKHLRTAYAYVRLKQEAGTIVWSHRPEEDWISDRAVGIIVMGKNGVRERRFEPPGRRLRGTSDAGV